MVALPPTEGGEVAAALLFRGDPVLCRGPRVWVWARAPGSGDTVRTVSTASLFFNQNWTDLVSNFGPGTALGRSRDASGERCRTLTRPGRPPGVLEASPRSYLLYSIENTRF